MSIEWYVFDAARGNTGPFRPSMVAGAIQNGSIKAATQVSFDARTWTAAGSTPAFAFLFGAAGMPAELAKGATIHNAPSPPQPMPAVMISPPTVRSASGKSGIYAALIIGLGFVAGIVFLLLF